MQGFGRLINREAGEKTEFNDAALLRVESLEIVQRVIQSDELQTLLPRRVEVFVERQHYRAATTFFAMRCTSVIDKDAAHDPAANCEKMSAVLPGCVFLADELQISFVDQSGAVQGMLLPLAPQLPVGDFVQLGVDQRSQFVDCGGVSGTPCVQQLGNISGSHVIELSRIS